MYTVCKVRIWNLAELIKVSNILYWCGRDMATKYDLHHWDNSHFKNWFVVVLCALKNRIYLVYDKKIPIATFQTRKINQSFLLQKLATLPERAGLGIGSFCLNEIENLGKKNGCQEIICDVYDKSEQARRFYENRGYRVYGVAETLKYKEFKMKKEL